MARVQGNRQVHVFSQRVLRKWRPLFELCSPIPISGGYTAYPLTSHWRLKMIIYIVSNFGNNALKCSLLTPIINKYCYRMRRLAWNHCQKHRWRVILIVMDYLCIVYILDTRRNKCKNTERSATIWRVNTYPAPRILSETTQWDLIKS